MKKALPILVAFILVFSMVLPVFAWSGDNHALCVSTSISEMETTYNIPIQFSDKELTLLYKCSKLPDNSAYKNPPGATSEVNSLHARGNYISCQRYLYEMAIAVLNSSLSTTSTTADVETFLTNYLNSCTYLTSSEISRMQLVNLSVKALITTKIISTGSTDTYELSKRKRSIKILGFLFHLIGDSYAHATIVPSSAVNYTTYNSTLNFKQADFTTSGVYTADQKWTAFQQIITQYDVCFADLDSLSTTTGSVYAKGASTPTNLTTLYDSNLLAAISSNLSSTKYEDKTSFLPARFSGTCTVARNILTDYNSALTSYANGTDIGSVGIYNKEHMNYFQDAGTGYTMRQFDTYYAAF
jgi:hypothetical protein